MFYDILNLFCNDFTKHTTMFKMYVQIHIPDKYSMIYGINFAMDSTMFKIYRSIRTPYIYSMLCRTDFEKNTMIFKMYMSVTISDNHFMSYITNFVNKVI